MLGVKETLGDHLFDVYRHLDLRGKSSKKEQE